MNKTHACLVAIIVCELAIIIGLLATPVTFYVETEIEPSPLDNELIFYVAYLRHEGYTVHESNLTTNRYIPLDFKQFLWVLQTTNETTCNVDYGASTFGWFGFTMTKRTPKVWMCIDGTYYEVRFPFEVDD